MTLITENGWPQIPASELDRGPIPGTRAVVELRAGDVSTVLKGWAAWYHRNVEPIDAGQRDEWGWSATNDVWNSNHLSGTAIDINATRYPWKHYTMQADKVAAVERGLDLFEGTVFWGRWWDRPDEMHYQIGCGPEQLAAFAARLRAGYLGIYGPDPEDDMPLTDADLDRIAARIWGEQIKNRAGQPVSREDMVRWIDSRLIAVEKTVDALAAALLPKGGK
ncbi:M15 family metallopeptidase [Nocardia cyriacigeorgica]|uniref:M15 family metallopeptidase n=1 Tax=Nocardia cyriacigeorgica TaxID=135487 RepID=UPI001893DB93|nr:M15 family metallopeptidase [Nocardia cyriacigeorgica]MBF6085292.1 M15 family metallopeptidase [Nocardia cyriacigeorgica]